jgi:hypothetical protein
MVQAEHSFELSEGIRLYEHTLADVLSVKADP